MIVLSDHGFEGHIKRFELGRWMVKNGYTKINWLFFRKSFRRFYKRYWRPLLSKLSLIDESSNDPLSSWFVWDRSRAFSVGRSGEGFIYLLDQSIKEQIINKLEALVDPGTNRKVIKKVWKREDLYQGDKLEKLPDLVVEPIAGYSCSGTPDHKERFHKINKDEDFHLGKHRQEGIGIISGPGVSKGKLEASIVDIAPTILYYLGVSRDKNIDGKVIIERK